MSAQGREPRPALEADKDIPTSLVCLVRGSPPLRVPTWMLDIMEGDDSGDVQIDGEN